MASPFGRVFTAKIAIKPAADATRDDTVVEVPYAGTVTAVSIIPDTAMSGVNTNSATLSLINKGTTGGGTAVAATLALTSGVDLVAFDAKAITVSTVTANVTVAAGDVLALSHIKVSSNVAVTTPPSLVKVTINATD